MKQFTALLTSTLFLFGIVISACANIPGGGDGTGPNVTLVNNGDGTVTMANGIVTAQIKIATAQVLQFTYNGFQVTDGGTAANNGFYWQGSSGSSDTLTTIVNPSTNGGNLAEIQLYDSATNSGANADAYRYFTMVRGSPGIYVAQVMAHTPAMPAGGVGIPSITCKLGADIFNWLAQDTGRNLLMERNADLGAAVGGINNAPKEVTLLTQGLLAGRFDCKYDMSGDLGALGFCGWCSTNQTTNFGLWMVHPSNEYFSDGPMHREILAQMIIVQATFTGVHYGFHPDMNVAAGENWSIVDGPCFLYFNKVAPGTTNAQAALHSDAAAQTIAERGAWPYTWFADTNYVPAAGRGTVTGQIVINDSGNPNASASNLWVGVVQQPSTPTSPAPTDFQLWGKNYQYWTKTRLDGSFTISNVIAGNNFTLFAFGPGAIGQFQSQPLPGASPTVTINTPASPFSVTVTGGQTNNLGTVTWTPTRVGATVWEIGVPDRDTTEFRHGDDYWHGDLGNATNFPANWAQWQDFSLDFPNGLTYTVGQSHWARDWDYAQSTIEDPATGNLNSSTWTISFNLANPPTNGAQASIYFGIAADYSGPLIVQVNGNNIAGSTGFFPYYSDTASANDAMIRMGSHGIFGDWRINFAGSLLQQGQNIITLNMRKGGYFSNGVLYDYLRLELAGYVPPPPSALSANAGNGLVALNWAAVPGATGYNVLRSTTSGSGYAAVATNVIGPVSGSVDDTAAFADTNVGNGTTYYYVIQSSNPTGTSSNSVQAAATPSVSTPAAPATPTNLTATSANNQATLTWDGSSGAGRYILQRTVLTIGAVTTYSPGGINPYRVINSYVTGTNYTDTALDNNVTYSYTVSAANANGQSPASSAISAIPLPNLTLPPTLSATVSSNQANLSWNIVGNAENYIISRATSISGPYTVVDDPEWLAFFSDSGLNYNTTYYYEAASADLGGISSFSAPISITTTPAPPSPITAIPGNSQVYVDWGDSSGATNYVVQRSTTSGGPYTSIGSSTNSNWLDITANNGTTYYYVVYAMGTNGVSPLSVQATATPSATPQMIKSDTTNMNSAVDWSGVTPTTNAVGLFNNIISAANEGALVLGGNVGLGGLTFSNNLNGAVSVASGNVLTLGSAGIDMSRANRSVTFNNAIALAATQVWNITNGQSVTLNGALTNAGNNLIKNGAGTIYLGTAVSDATANIQVNSGTVQGNTSSGITISLNGGTFNNHGSFAANPIYVMSGGTEQNVGGNETWIGNLTGSGPLTVVASSIHTWSGNNTNYTGTITLQGSGTLRLNSLTTVGPGTAYSFNGGTMSANASGLFSLGSLSGSGTINTASGENFSLGALGLNTTFSGVIAGAGFVQKDGGGTLTLSGANTYTGGTTINAGELLVNNSAGSGTGTGAVTVNSGGALGGSGFVSGAVTVNAGGTFAPGMDGLGTLTLSNSLTLAAGCTNVFGVSQTPLTNGVAKTSGALANGGTLIVTNAGTSALIGGDSFKLLNAASYSGKFARVILPPLASGLAWNTNALNTSGIISIVTLTSPAIAGLRISGADLIISGAGGTASWPYTVLASTNLAASQWLSVATNSFDASGNFTVTLTNAATLAQAQTFYKLQLQ